MKSAKLLQIRSPNLMVARQHGTLLFQYLITILFVSQKPIVYSLSMQKPAPLRMRFAIHRDWQFVVANSKKAIMSEECIKIIKSNGGII